MKKIFITLAALVCASAFANAQTLLVVEESPVLTNKHGARILPQAGDIAISVSANPFFRYLGNMFTRDGVNEAPVFGGNDAIIYGKFFMTDNSALRVGIGLNFYNNYRYANDVTSNTGAGFVTDEMKMIQQGVNLMVGYEWRRGYNRLQGFYGVEVSAGWNRRINEYSFGNHMNGTVPLPWTWNFATGTQDQVASRIVKEQGAGVLNASVYGFVGAEYFFLPKMSLGGELRLGFGYEGRGKTKVTTQMWSTVDNKIDETVVETSNSNVVSDGFAIKTITQGAIYLNFYF